MKKVLYLIFCGVLGAMVAGSGWKVTEIPGATAIVEDKTRLIFAIVSAIVLNFVYYASAPPGVSWWFYMDFKKMVSLVVIFIVAQLVFNFLIL